MKLLSAGPDEISEILTHRSVEGLVHTVWRFLDSTLAWDCVVNVRKVYGTRSTSYLPDELGDANNQPVTCLWCLTGQRRT